MSFQLRDRLELEKHYEVELLRNLAWLKAHLKSPVALEDEKNFRAISWFNPRAIEPLKRIRGLVVILEEYGHAIDTLITNDPGVIIYEDGWQVVAKPVNKSA